MPTPMTVTKLAMFRPVAVLEQRHGDGVWVSGMPERDDVLTKVLFDLNTECNALETVNAGLRQELEKAEQTITLVCWWLWLSVGVCFWLAFGLVAIK